jgi:DeoR family fructose operon transcriptional repressor
MPLNERQIEIVRILRRLKQVSVNDLRLRFRTSAVTIRKDLDELQERGFLVRTHGGAVLAENVEETEPVDAKLGRNVALKEVVARAALEQVFDCETVALDAGSTTLAIARLLKDSPVNIVTNSLSIAEELAQRESGSMTLVGGAWRRESSCFMGPLALHALDRMNIDIAFVGASGISPRTGFTCQNAILAQVKERMLLRSDRRFIVSDSSKYGLVAFSTFASFDEVDGWIVDADLAEESRATLVEQGLHIITASDKAVVDTSRGGRHGRKSDEND